MRRIRALISAMLPVFFLWLVFVGLVFVGLVLVGLVATAEAAPAAPVSARSGLDRPAIWVADRVTFTADITCARDYDILADDLSRDKLTLAPGLEIIGSDVQRQTQNGETHYTVRYVLTTYRVDVATLTVAPLSVRYFVRRPGLRPEEAVPAGTVVVPGAAVARRSLLADDQATYEIRDGRAADARPRLLALMTPMGIGLLLLSAAPVALLAIGVGRRLYARRGQVRPPSARQVRHAARERLDAVRLTDAGDEVARREGFAEIDALLRDHLAAVSHLPATSLTSTELAAALDPRDARLPLDRVRTVLAACELARYAPRDRLPTAEAFRDVLADAEQVLATR
jgi:hypothetical protein